jgi:hypothetical protein
MLRRTCFLLVLSAALLSGSGKTAKAQGWTFTETVSHSGPGPCIPYPQLPPLVYYTKDACEYNRSAELSNNGDDWSAYGDGSCILIITCTPCVGSDIGGSGTSGSGSSILGDPGEVSISGLLTGNALFSPHDIKDIENWAGDYMQRMKSMGITDEGIDLITSGDVPLTGNAGFDKYYAEQMLQFQKPEQGGTVYLKEGQETIDPNDLKASNQKTISGTPAASAAAGAGALASSVPVLGSVNYALADYNFSEIPSSDAGIDAKSAPGASFNVKMLDLIKELATNQYAEWAGNLTNETCSNISQAARILGSPDITSLSPEDEQRYDATTVLYKASVTSVTSGLTGEAIGTIVKKSVKAVEYVGEKASIKLCSDVDPAIVKADYKDGLALGKAVMDLSSKAQKVWGLFKN